MSDSASVYRQSERIGTITRTRKGSLFEYDERFFSENAGRPGGIATHLPYSRRRTETLGTNLHTYFAGLLPEGLRLKALIRSLKASEDDLLSLLIAAGVDCVGDVSVMPAGRRPADIMPTADLARLKEVVFEDLFRQSLSDQGKRSEPSIPGVQEKISAAMISLPLKAKKAKKSYILKLNPADKSTLVANEEFFLRMAKACGLETPVASLVRDKTDALGLLVERFDRETTREGASIKLHQEDACQFLDRYPADKYRIPCSEIAEGLSICSAPIIEVGRFIRLVAYSYLIGNGDLHAKNVSIRTLPGSGRVELTPAYDLLTTLPYGDPKMALKLDGRDDNIKRAHFVAFGERYGVKAPATRAILDRLIEAAAPWIAQTKEIGFDAKKTRQLQTLMSKRHQDLGGSKPARSRAPS